MGTDVRPFTFPTTGQTVRTVLVDGEPWFVAADVCAVLGISNSRDAVSRLDSAERGVGETDTPGGRQSVTIISEAGLYRLVMRSNRSEAVRFQVWIAHDVLPTIRATGRYEVEPPSRLELARRWFEAEQELVAVTEERDTARAQLADTAPKAEAFEAFMDADGTYSVEEVAKMLLTETGLGRNSLFARLRELDVLQDSNVPYQRYAHHFHVVASSFTHTDGRRQATYTTRVRASGVEFIRRKLGCTQSALVPVTDLF